MIETLPDFFRIEAPAENKPAKLVPLPQKVDLFVSIERVENCRFQTSGGPILCPLHPRV